MRRALICSLMLVVISATVVHGECRDALDKAVDTFMDKVFAISRLNKQYTPDEKDVLCQKAADHLTAVAKEFRVPTEELKALLQEYLDYESNYREPPPGWDADDRKANLILFSDLAKQRLRMDLALVSYGRRWCHRAEK